MTSVSFQSTLYRSLSAGILLIVLATAYADCAQAQMVIHPRWSSDGGRLVYYVYRDGTTDIYVSQVDGNSPHRLTNDDIFVSNPDFSPNGCKLVYGRNVDGNWDAYIHDLESGSIERRTTSEGREMHFSWSPNGEWISFIRWLSDDNTEVFIQNVETGAERQLTSQGSRIFHPKWSFDNRWIVFDGPTASEASGAFRVRTDMEAQPELLTAGLQAGTRATTPALSPDGNTLAYSFRTEGEDRGHIWLMDMTTRRSWALKHDQNAGAPVFSPDGKYLAFHSSENGDFDPSFINVFDFNTESTRVIPFPED
jgi:Tol biopolymer transport system component